MKEIIILKHGGGELANQLWNYASVYAYGLETDTPVRNPSFYEYHSFFNFLPDERWTTKMRAAFFRTPRRRSSFLSWNFRLKYRTDSWIVAKLRSRCVFSSENSSNQVTLLPPSSAIPERFKDCSKLYLTGWLFRNPVGLSKHRVALIDAFAPNHDIAERIDAIIKPLRAAYSNVIGGHIRQSDYKTFKNGAYYIDQKRVREIIDEYIHEKSLDTAKTIFVMASDGAIDADIFKGLNIHISRENAVVDLFLLSETDAILGSDSSFGDFAAWYGDIPHIIFKKEPVDWAYYRGKDRFFENRYCTMVQY